MEARSKATQIKVDANNLTPEKLAEYQKAQGAVTSALGKLLAITENYPDLKANQNFLELQAQLEGTENRINVDPQKILMTLRRHTIPLSVGSRKASLLPYSVSKNVLISKQPKARKKAPE